MKTKIAQATIFLFFLGTSMAFAANGKVTISSPADGAMVGARDTIKLAYEADRGSEGDHLHLNVDGKRMDVIRQLKGAIDVAPLMPGKHRICLAVNTKGHVPTGVEECVSVTSK